MMDVENAFKVIVQMRNGFTATGDTFTVIDEALIVLAQAIEDKGDKADAEPIAVKKDTDPSK